MAVQEADWPGGEGDGEGMGEVLCLSAGVGGDRRGSELGPSAEETTREADSRREIGRAHV